MRWFVVAAVVVAAWSVVALWLWPGLFGVGWERVGSGPVGAGLLAALGIVLAGVLRRRLPGRRGS